MGLIQNKPSPSGSDPLADLDPLPRNDNPSRGQDDIGDDVVVKSPAEPKVPADANLLVASEFPSRDLPPITGGREMRFQVIFRQSVLDEIHRHGKASPEVEVCGVLIGDVFQDGVAPYAYVQACIPGNEAVGKQTQVTITSETWSRIHDIRERLYPGQRILGWYHTHPGFGIFLSGMDLFIQDNFFNVPWQFAFVYDPVGGDEGVFIWREGKSSRENFLTENDTGATPDGAAGSDKFKELESRVKSLERRLDWILTGFLFLILLALVLPLIAYLFGPPDLLHLPNMKKGQSNPAATQPARSGGDPATQPGHGAPKSTTRPAGQSPESSSGKAGQPEDQAHTAGHHAGPARQTVLDAPVLLKGDGSEESDADAGGPKILTRDRNAGAKAPGPMDGQ